MLVCMGISYWLALFYLMKNPFFHSVGVTPNRPHNMKCMFLRYLEIGLRKRGRLARTYMYKPSSKELWDKIKYQAA
jgi:hypothetical protein